MIDLLKQTVTVGELIEYAKFYDGNGSNMYEENMYEGASVIIGFIKDKFEENLDVIKLFPYMGAETG